MTKKRKNKSNKKGKSGSKYQIKLKKLRNIEEQQVKRNAMHLSIETKKDALPETKSNSNSSQSKIVSKIPKIIDDLNKIVKQHHFSSMKNQNLFDGADEAELSKRFSIASSWFNDQPSDASNIESLCIGFDLGSTSTKIVLRFPYNESLGAFAVPAPLSLQTEENPYFWKSQVSCSEIGEFSLMFRGKANYKSSLKLDFVRATKAREPNTPSVTEAEIYITAYMALMIRQSIGWLISELQETLRGKSLDISANFGLPAESVEDVMGAAFLSCCNAAMALAKSDTIVSKTAVSKAIEKSKGSPENYAIKIIPEFIGAVVGFFNSTRRRNGQFMLADIGGLTSDCTCFSFFEPGDGTSVINIYTGRVRNFGSDVVNIAVQDRLEKSELTLVLGNFVAETLKDSRSRIGPHAGIWGNEMSVFKIGGGISNDLFRGMFAWAEKSLENSKWQTVFKKEKISIEENTVDINLAKPGSCDRLLVALGLSWSNYDLPDWKHRHELKIIPELGQRDIEANYIGSEQT